MSAKETQTSLLNAIRIYAVCKLKDAEWRYSDLLNRLSEHEQQLCKEQREICRKAYTDAGFAKDIENAQMPEL